MGLRKQSYLLTKSWQMKLGGFHKQKDGWQSLISVIA